MSRPENSAMPPPPTAEETLRTRNMLAQRNMEIAKVTQFHSDEDVRMKINNLRILGVYPTPEINTEEDVKIARAFLSGFHEGIRQTIKTPRSGGIA